MREKLYILGFTLAISAVFGVMIAGLNSVLRERIELNAQAADQRVILELLGVKPTEAELVSQGEEPWSSRQVFDAFNEKVEATPPAPENKAAIEAERTQAVYRIYRLKSGQGPTVIPLGGVGFWDRINGYLAVDTDKREIVGIDFTEQSETPGLGARIEEQWWRDQFAGLSFERPREGGQFVEVVPPGTAEKQRAEVDAITGATETSRALETIVNEALQRYLQYLQEQNAAAGGTP